MPKDRFFWLIGMAIDRGLIKDARRSLLGLFADRTAGSAENSRNQWRLGSILLFGKLE